jgi:hypothetical protein
MESNACKEFDKSGQCKTVPYKDIKKYNRIDAEFYVRQKPKVEQFFKEHRIVKSEWYPDGKIGESKSGDDIAFIKKCSAGQLDLLSALISEYEKYEKVKKILAEAYKVR